MSGITILTMEHPKFILTNTGHLRLGMVNLHRDLLLPGEQCMGGGYYEFDYINSRLILDRESYDYGPPLWHLFDTLHVEALYQGFDIIYRSADRYAPELHVSKEIRIIYD